MTIFLLISLWFLGCVLMREVVKTFGETLKWHYWLRYPAWPILVLLAMFMMIYDKFTKKPI